MAALGPFLLVGLLIAMRNPTPLRRAEFWAEDALVFFTEALNHGWQSIYMPVYGYHFLLSRLIAWTATKLPVVAAPYVYAWAALVANAIAVGYFSRPTFGWVVPSHAMRLFACFLLVLAPGSGEVLMNLCNLMTPLTLLAFLLLLESPGQLGWGRFTLFVFLAASAGPVFLLTPLSAYLAWRTKNIRYLVLIGATLPVFVANVVGNHVTGSQNGLLNYSFGVLIPAAVADNLSLRLFVLPLTGPDGAAAIMTAPPPVYWSVAGMASFAMLALWWWGRPAGVVRLRDDAAVVMHLIGFACATLTFAGIAISRSYAVFQILRSSADPLWQLRYSYLPGAVAVLVWTLLGHRLTRIRGTPAAMGYAVLAVIALHEVSQWTNYPPRPDIGWPRAAVAIQNAVDARARGALPHAVAASVPVHPTNWRNGLIVVQIEPAERRR